METEAPDENTPPSTEPEAGTGGDGDSDPTTPTPGDGLRFTTHAALLASVQTAGRR